MQAGACFQDAAQPLKQLCEPRHDWGVVCCNFGEIGLVRSTEVLDNKLAAQWATGA